MKLRSSCRSWFVGVIVLGIGTWAYGCGSITFTGNDEEFSSSTRIEGKSVATPELISYSGSCGTALEAEVLSLVNQERTSRGLNALQCYPKAVTSAHAYSQAMCDQAFFSHVDPQGKDFGARLSAAGFTGYQWAGENLAMTYSDSASSVMQAWMGSSAHRDNILFAQYTHLGAGYVACATSGANKHYWTQHFFAFAANPPEVTPNPTPVCVPSCANKPCGDSDGCSGTCAVGSGCVETLTCQSGKFSACEGIATWHGPSTHINKAASACPNATSFYYWDETAQTWHHWFPNSPSYVNGNGFDVSCGMVVQIAK